MPYTIDKYNGTTVAIVEDGTIDSTLDIKLIGKNYAGYGEVQNENFVHLLENFAGVSPPPRPIAGQIWYNSGTKKINYYDATAARWKTAGGAEVSATAPAGLSEGDFWWDTVNDQLYVYNGAGYTLIGPQGLANFGTTQIKSLAVTDTSAVQHAVIAAYVNGKISYVISTDSAEYTLSTASADLLNGTDAGRFGIIYPGLTLANTNNTTGVTDPRTADPTKEKANFWGTASNSNRLGGYLASNYIRTDNSDFPSLVKFADDGFVMGTGSDRLEVFIESPDRIPVIQNLESNTIEFRTTSGTPLKLLGNNILPGLNSTTDLGTTAVRFRNAYVDDYYGSGANLTSLNATQLTSGIVSSSRLSGTYNISISGNAATASLATAATNSDNLKVGTTYMSASQSATASTVAARTTNDEVISGTLITAGSLKSNYFVGTATAALFADLAEKYMTDQPYDVGTVVMVGGDAEVTACTLGARAFGAVSENPAYMMNSGLEGGTYIALKGRVPVKVIGAVQKGDRLVAANNGCAGASHVLLKNIPIRAGGFPDTFAIALESNNDEGVKLVECIIL